MVEKLSEHSVDICDVSLHRTIFVDGHDIGTLGFLSHLKRSSIERYLKRFYWEQGGNLNPNLSSQIVLCVCDFNRKFWGSRHTVKKNSVKNQKRKDIKKQYMPKPIGSSPGMAGLPTGLILI